MAVSGLKDSQLRSMSFEQALDHIAPQIMLKGFGRPWQLWAAHGALIATNYVSFLVFVRRDLCRLLLGRVTGGTVPFTEEDEEKERRAKLSLASKIFSKFLVWQHLAEAIGCRQGPIGGHFGLPNNWKFRLSLGTIKYPLLPFLGKRRNIVDLVVHLLFFATGVAFLKAKEYKLKYIRAFCVCDVWIALSDLSQFFASTGHAYFSMLLSCCFAENQGRLAGIQSALIIQWFFSGIGKIGHWFSYVNAPFMLQSKILGGQRWLFDLLVRSPADLGPTLFGIVLAHAAASVEYLGPIALMFPRKMRRSLPSSAERPTAPAATGSTLAESTAPPAEKALVPVPAKHDLLANASIWFGLTGLVAMHTYILTMPAPFDVYSWNLCFGLSAIYLFYYASFGFDHMGAKTMHRGLAGFLFAEFVLCWYGQFFPDQVGYYLSHRYWAGNWVQTLFYVKNTEVVRAKLGRVKTFSSKPQIWQSLEHLGRKSGLANTAYLWLATFNMKSVSGLVHKAVQLTGGTGAKVADYIPIGLTQMCCGEFRDSLYALPLLPTIQEQIGFEAGECFMVRLGAFGMFQNTATWGIYDLKEGLVKGGLLTIKALCQMDSFPSQSIGRF